MQNIHVVWDGPYSHAEALQLNSPSDFGLYQYYGDHHVYGNSALLYIGKVHSDESLELDEWRRQIDLAERILLQSHSPSFNSSNLNTIGRNPGFELGHPYEVVARGINIKMGGTVCCGEQIERHPSSAESITR